MCKWSTARGTAEPFIGRADTLSSKDLAARHCSLLSARREWGTRRRIRAGLLELLGSPPQLCRRCRAAVHYEKGDYDATISDCDAAVERGRELRADYKMVARALTRKGNALAKKGDLPAAIAVYNKALTEHRHRPGPHRTHLRAAVPLHHHHHHHHHLSHVWAEMQLRSDPAGTASQETAVSNYLAATPARGAVLCLGAG